MSSNYAKVKSNKWASDDDAGSLLAGILDETETAAQVEQSRLEAEMKAKQEEERLRKAEEERQRVHEAEQRLNAEHSRQNQLKQRRTERMEALRIEDLKEKGEWIDPAIEQARLAAEEARRVEESQQHQMEVQMQQMQQQMQQMAQPAANTNQAAAQATATQKASSKGPFIALAAVLFMVVAAGAVIGGLMSQQYEPDATNYPKFTMNPVDSEDVVTTAGVTPLPEPEPVVVAEVAPEVKKSKKRRSSGKKRSSKKSTKKKKGKKFEFNDKDLFGGGF